MLSWWAAVLLLPAGFIALVDWRKGLVAMIGVAFLQDPARKLELGRPVYFTLLVGMVWAVMLWARGPRYCSMRAENRSRND